MHTHDDGTQHEHEPEGLVVSSAVQASDGMPAVQMSYTGPEEGGWSIMVSAADARKVAGELLGAAAAAEADAMLYRFAQQNLGATQQLAAQFLIAFRALRQQMLDPETLPLHESIGEPMVPSETEASNG
jgi:hypothetical protein